MVMWRNLGNSVYTKILFGGIVAFSAIIGGVYFGYAMLGSKPGGGGESAPASQLPSDAIAIRLAAGDAFPLEEYVDSHGRKGNFEWLLQNKETILILVSTSCSPCLDLLKYAHDSMRNRLKSGVQVVVVIGRDSWPPIDEYVGLFDDVDIALVDAEYWGRTYRWAYWPIIIGVDNSGIVVHMQYGFAKTIDRELVEYFYSAKQ